MSDLTLQEWKDNLNAKATEIESMYEELFKVVETLDDIEGDIDTTDAATYMVIRFGKINKHIESLG